MPIPMLTAIQFRTMAGAETIMLSNDGCRAAISPSLGASVLELSALVNGEWEHLLRPSPENPKSSLETSMALMAPWVNRISSGGFTHGDTRVDLEPNFPGEPLPLHGNALQLRWTVDSADKETVCLSVDSDGPGRFRYRAKANYQVLNGGFHSKLEVTNTGPGPLPFGLGFHPWFVRTKDTHLTAPAERVCIMDCDNLPDRWERVADHPDLDFSWFGELPESHVDNPFSGWNGNAHISREDPPLMMMIVASESVNKHYQFYSPGPGCGFFCFEPVSHAVDEHNRRGSSPQPGLKVLGPGETIDASILLSWKVLEQGPPDVLH